jgi:hypothetical protein
MYSSLPAPLTTQTRTQNAQAQHTRTLPHYEYSYHYYTDSIVPMSWPQAPRYSTSEEAFARSPSLSFNRITWYSRINTRVHSGDQRAQRSATRNCVYNTP